MHIFLKAVKLQSYLTYLFTVVVIENGLGYLQFIIEFVTQDSAASLTIQLVYMALFLTIQIIYNSKATIHFIQFQP